VPRRLLALAAVALAGLAATSGCASDVAPAVQIDGQRISNDDLLAEVAEWRGSPTLMGALQLPTVDVDGPDNYPTQFVDFVLSNRISFEIHNAEFAALDLELSDSDLEEVRSQLLDDPATTEAVLKELSSSYADQLIADVARQTAVRDAHGDGYNDWVAEAFGAAEIDVNPRFGRWDAASGQVVGPDGPLDPSTTGP
jgi:hypothetical protein